MYPYETASCKTIGRTPDTPDGGGGQFFSGVIDEAAIFANALSLSQLRLLQDAAFAPAFQSVSATNGAVV